MKRRGLINWSTKLAGTPQKTPTNAPYGGSAADPSNTSIFATSASPSRTAAAFGGASKTTGVKVTQKDGSLEVQANLHIHEQQSNVLVPSQQDGAVELIYLGDEDNFNEGDILEIAPVSQAQAQDPTTFTQHTKRTDSSSGLPRMGSIVQISQQARLSPQSNKQKTVEPPSDQTSQQELRARTSLVVSLGKSFYKASQQPKKFYVSLAQHLADQHGLRKDMLVTVRRLSPNFALLTQGSNTTIQPAKNQSTLRGLPKSIGAASLSRGDFGPQRGDPMASRFKKPPGQNGSNQNGGKKEEEIRQLQALVGDRIEVTVRDQYASRRDMWQLIQELSGTCVHKNQQIVLQSVRFKIRNIYSAIPCSPQAGATMLAQQTRGSSSTSPLAKQPSSFKVAYVEQSSAIVSKSVSRFTFLSKSCQVYCLIELATEMFEFDAQGFLQAEKCLLFVKSYLERCKTEHSTHEVVFVLFSRLYYPQATNPKELLEAAREHSGRADLTWDQLEKEGAFEFSKGKAFRDFYLKAGVVTLSLDSSTKTETERFLAQLKAHIQQFPTTVNWQYSCPQHLQRSTQTPASPRHNDCFRLPCEVGDSSRSNILEVINLALFNLNNEETDINLRTTGTQMLILSAGQATYRVNSEIIAPTKSRLLLGGVQVKLISLAREPPYRTPLLVKCCQYTNPFCARVKTRSGHNHSMLRLSSATATTLQSLRQVQTHPSQNLARAKNTPPTFFTKHQSDPSPVDHHDADFLLDWMEVTFLPHIKLLETYVTKEALRKASASLSLSKTALLSAQFWRLQQVDLQAQLFGGLKSQTQRVFEPHSMFLASFDRQSTPSLLSLLSQTQQAALSMVNSSDTLRFPVQTQSQVTKEPQRKSKNGKKKYWRLGPELFQLREPSPQSAKELTSWTHADEQAAPNTTTSLSTHRYGVSTIVEDESQVGSSDETGKHTTSKRQLNAPTTSSFRLVTSSVGANHQDLSVSQKAYDTDYNPAKRALLSRLNQHDVKLSGKPREEANEVVSPHTSQFSSPTKSTGSRMHVTPEPLVMDANRNFARSILEQQSSMKLQGAQKNNPLALSNMINARQQAKQEISSRLMDQLGQTQEAGGGRMGNLNISTTSFRLSQPRPEPRLQLSPVRTNFQSQVKLSETVQAHQSLQRDKAKIPSFARRWAHACLVFPHSLFQTTSQDMQSRRLLAREGAWNWLESVSYSQAGGEWGGTERSANAFELAVTQNHFEPLCKLMEPFWKQLTEVVMMPLTTEFYPGVLGEHNGYAKEEKQSEWRADVGENLCLRLTQNFQFVDQRGCCDFKNALAIGAQHYKMALRNVYCECTQVDLERFENKTHFKFKNDQDKPIQENVAAFSYLLFNHHTKQFQAKTSSESRLFEIRRLKNLDNVQSDLREAKETCIKFPCVSFVIFYDREEARKQRLAAGEPPLPTAIHEEDEEVRAFQKLVTGLNRMLQQMGPKQRVQLDTVKVLTRQTYTKEDLPHEAQDFFTATKDEPDRSLMHQLAQSPAESYSPGSYSLSISLQASSGKYMATEGSQYQVPVGSNGHSNAVIVEEDASGYETPKASRANWQHDMMGSFLGTGATGKQQDAGPGAANYQNAPYDGSSRASNASVYEGTDPMNQSMTVQFINKHASILNTNPLSQPGFLAQSNRVVSSSFTVKRGLHVKNGQEEAKSPAARRCVFQVPPVRSESSGGVGVQGGHGKVPSQQQAERTASVAAKQCEFMLEHDHGYTTGACFHLKFSWIFARGPDVQERVIKRFFRQVKELSNGCFKALPLSEIIRSLQLNPFECETVLRVDGETRWTEALQQRNDEEASQLRPVSALINPRFSVAAGDANDFSLCGLEDEDSGEAAYAPGSGGARWPDRSHENRQTIRQKNVISLQEQRFQRIFPRLLTTQCGYVLDNKSKDEQRTYFLEKESGLSYVSLSSSNRVTYSENDIVNNTNGDYQASAKSKLRVEAAIAALDTLLSLLYDQQLLGRSESQAPAGAGSERGSQDDIIIVTENPLEQEQGESPTFNLS